MSEVRLSVGGRDYSVACAEGEEAHVARLGEAIDGKLQQLGSGLSNKEAENLLFAALLLADELHERREETTGAQTSPAALDAELERLRSALEEAELGRSAAGSEIETLRADVETARASETALRTELENLRIERDSARSATAFDDPGLAPSLERFAELLENCADKLEGKPPAS
ncbi:cell division protein ZapA [Pelagerythrobacter sp.]|uniref:cell division protein ZapA n=1 Tax=Pelagerythrobacter sp. TaxID=2800702 RepID=UPI0035B23E46